jgi:beta-lactamase class A
MRRLAATIGAPVRSLVTVVGVMLGMLGAGPVALGATKPVKAAHPVKAAQSAKTARSPQAALASSLNSTIRHAGGRSGAYVLDLDTGQSLFSYSPDVGRLPASV